MGRFKFPVGVKIFIAIWLVALCVPSVRELPTTLAAYELFQPLGEFNSPTGGDFARRFPDNPTAALWGAEDEWRGYPVDLDAAEMPIEGGDKAALKQIAARFPGDLQIRALQLRTFSEGYSGMSKDRIQNDLKLRARWIEAAQIARVSAALEPNNVFWPWMEAGFEFAANRNDAALRAFERAGRCTRYDDYVMATFKARLDLWKSVDNPSWEQEFSLWASVPLPHLATMQGATAQITTRAIALRKAGEVGRAFALEADVLTVTRLLHRDADSIVTGFVAEKSSNASLEKFTGTARPEGDSVQDFEKHATQLAQKWAQLARQNGQGALAARADWMRGPSVRRLYHFEDPTFSSIGMRAPWGIMAMVAPMILLAFGLVIMAGGLLWIAGRWLRFVGASPTRGQVVMCANFSFWLIIGVIAVGVGLSWREYWFSYNLGVGLAVYSAFGLGLTALLSWLLPVWFLGLKTNRQWSRARPANPRPLSVGMNVARVVSWLVFGVALILTITNGRGLWDGTWFTFSNSALACGVATVIVLALEFARWQQAGWRIKSVPREGAIAPQLAAVGPNRWALYGLCLLCGVLLVPIALNFSYPPIMPFCFASVAIIAAFVIGWRLSRAHFQLQLAHRSMGILVVMWSVVFLSVAVAAWPLRAELNSNMDRRINISEIAWAREQATK